MKRLYFRIYVAVLASLLVFALAAGVLWRTFAGSVTPWQGTEVAARLAHADHADRGGPGLAVAGMLLLLLVVVGAAAHPVVRRITRRLERLQAGVESLERGDLSARVKVGGHDEIARLAASFNRAAARIEALVNAHRMLLANASHELRTPLTRIRLGVELLKEAADPRRKAELERDIAELDQLIDAILLASRLDALTEPEVREEVDLLALAAEECARYDGCRVEGESARVAGDPQLLRRMIRNLLDNALRHGRPPVAVAVHQVQGRAQLRVTDQGPGIPVAEHERVFEPFRRATGAGAKRGSGLGLALVRRIARHHGGEARIEPGAGSGLTVVVVI